MWLMSVHHEWPGGGLLADLEGELVDRLARRSPPPVGAVLDPVAVIPTRVNLEILDAVQGVEVSEGLVTEEIETIGGLLRGQSGVRGLPMRVARNPRYAHGSVDAHRDGGTKFVEEDTAGKNPRGRDSRGELWEDELEVAAVENR